MIMQSEHTYGVDLSDLRVEIRSKKHGDGEDAPLQWGQFKKSRFPCNAPQAVKASHRQPKRRSSCIDQNFPSVVDKPVRNCVAQKVDAMSPQRNGNARRRTELESLQEKPVISGQISMGISKWPRLLIPLSLKEKEEDFMVMKGSRLPQRPKKRAKHVEKFVSYISPGAWHFDLTVDRYEVKGEKQCLKKKSTGLRAMESMDSDSEE